MKKQKAKVFLINKDTPYDKFTGPDPQVIGKLLESGLVKDNLIMIIEIDKPDHALLKQVTSQDHHLTIYVEPLLYQDLKDAGYDVEDEKEKDDD